jgi:hypothetical protein
MIKLLEPLAIEKGIDNDGNSVKISKWWTWVSTYENNGYQSSAYVNINPTSDNTGCDVNVSGYPNPENNNWAAQAGCDYNATAGKTYKVSWKWISCYRDFMNVTIRFAQQKDYQNDSDYMLGTDMYRLAIPTFEET